MSNLRGSTGGGDHPGYLLRRLAAAFRRRLEDCLRDRHLPLSMAQMAVLVELADEPGASGAQLARRTMISAQAISTVLRRLERGGHISRAADPDNQRRRCWQLTRMGKNALLRAGHAAEPVMKRMLSGLTVAERRKFLALLKNCIGALESD